MISLRGGETNYRTRLTIYRYVWYNKQVKMLALGEEQKENVKRH